MKSTDTLSSLTDLTKWDENVLKPALSVVDGTLRGRCHRFAPDVDARIPHLSRSFPRQPTPTLTRIYRRPPGVIPACVGRRASCRQIVRSVFTPHSVSRLCWLTIATCPALTGHFPRLSDAPSVKYAVRPRTSLSSSCSKRGTRRAQCAHTARGSRMSGQS